MATIDNLSLSITAQATDATKKIDALSNALKGFKGSANLSSAVNNLTKLKEALSALNRIKVNDEKLSGISAGIKSTAKESVLMTIGIEALRSKISPR